MNGPLASSPRAVLLDLDGVVYVEDVPVPGAREAVERLRAAGLALRFVTNTTAHSRPATFEKLRGLGFPLEDDELVTPAALAVGHCLTVGHRRVSLLMSDEVKGDFRGLDPDDESPQAVIVGDLGERFDYSVLNRAFRHIMDGAELVALQKNRYWRRADGLSLDVGPSWRRSSTRRLTAPMSSASPPPASSTEYCTVLAVRRRRQRWSGTTSRATWAERLAPD